MKSLPSMEFYQDNSNLKWIILVVSSITMTANSCICETKNKNFRKYNYYRMIAERRCRVFLIAFWVAGHDC